MLTLIDAMLISLLYPGLRGEAPMLAGVPSRRERRRARRRDLESRTVSRLFD